MSKVLMAFALLAVFSLGASGFGREIGGCMRSVSQEFIVTAHAEGLGLGVFHKPKPAPVVAEKPGPVVEIRPAGNPPKEPMPLWKQIGRAGFITFAVQSIVGVLKVGASVLLPFAIL